MNHTDSTVLYQEVETARVPKNRIHVTVAKMQDNREKGYTMGDKGKKDKDKSQKQKKNKDEQMKKKKREKQSREIL